MYNLQHVLQIIPYIHPFHALNDKFFEWLEHRWRAQYRFHFGPMVQLIFFFQTFRPGWEPVQALRSSMYHVPRSMGLRSDEERSHISLDQKAVKLLWHQAWTILTVWAVVPFCCSVKTLYNIMVKVKSVLLMSALKLNYALTPQQDGATAHTAKMVSGIFDLHSCHKVTNLTALSSNNTQFFRHYKVLKHYRRPLVEENNDKINTSLDCYKALKQVN